MRTTFVRSIASSIVGALVSLATTIAADAKVIQVPGDYSTLQAAINASQTNDTIQIAPGVYTGQVQINSKSLTLIGQPGTILRATTSMPRFPDSSVIPLIGIRRSQVTMRGLTLEGEQLAGRLGAPYDLLGIYLRQSSATVENCAFYGFRENTLGKSLAGAMGVLNTEPDAAEVRIRVAGSTFADNYNGVFFIGSPTRKSIDVTVENNTLTGPGPLNTSDSIIGILFREGAGGRILGNTVSGYSYIGTGADSPTSFGILSDNEANYPAFGIAQPVLIEGNILRNNQFHIALLKSDGSVVSNNRFQGTAPGIIPVGLAVTGTNVTIANNQFENMEEGIRLMGHDPTFGTSLGKAVDAQVTSNRFCGVTTPVNLQPLASATQVGTLVSCPIPPPPLAIAPAVLLSWPGLDDGWAVESATTVDGPWAASNATPFTQYGRHTIAVPVEGGDRFFRLR